MLVVCAIALIGGAAYYAVRSTACSHSQRIHVYRSADASFSFVYPDTWCGMTWRLETDTANSFPFGSGSAFEREIILKARDADNSTAALTVVVTSYDGIGPEELAAHFRNCVKSDAGEGSKAEEVTREGVKHFLVEHRQANRTQYAMWALKGKTTLYLGLEAWWRADEAEAQRFRDLLTGVARSFAWPG